MIACPTIAQIWQKDNYTFTIQWKDGKVQDFRLSDVQKICPCASCTDATTGKRLLSSEAVSEEVKATVIQSVGRYGIRIHFTSGCSAGIYPLNYLYRFGIYSTQLKPGPFGCMKAPAVDRSEKG